MEFSRFNGYDIKDKTSRELLTDLREEHDTLKDEHDELRSEHDFLKDNHDELRSEHDSLKDSHDELRSEHDSLKDNHDTLREEHDSLRNEYDSHTHSKSEITDFAHTHNKSEITDFVHGHDVSEVVGAVSIEKIWLNPAPYSSFPAQSLNFDNLDQFSALLILGKYSTGAYQSEVLYCNFHDWAGFSMNFAVSSIANRTVIISNNKITFEDAQLLSNLGGTSTVYNECAVPTAIFGIKGVQ